MLYWSCSPLPKTFKTASVCRSITKFGQPENTLNALSLNAGLPSCVGPWDWIILKAWACRACQGRPRTMPWLERSQTVSTVFRLTWEETSWERENKSRRSRVASVWCDRWSYNVKRGIDGEGGFELLLLDAGAGLKSRRRRRTREKDRIYRILNTKEKGVVWRAYHFCVCCNCKLCKSQEVEFRRMRQALINCLFCTENTSPVLTLERTGWEKTLLCTDFIITKYKVGQDLGQFCSNLRWNDRFHDTLVDEELSATLPQSNRRSPLWILVY